MDIKIGESDPADTSVIDILMNEISEFSEDYITVTEFTP